MEDIFFKKDLTEQWAADLCEYYSVSQEEALELGTRRDNRRPNLPGSKTTHPVSGMTFEEIWALKPRDTVEGVFEFYKDQGAWSTFRQVVRHKDLTQFHLSVLQSIVKPNSVFCEYGCGVAPFASTLLREIPRDFPVSVYLSDVDCEHFVFGEWRNKKTILNRRMSNASLHAVEIKPNSLPSFDKKLDAVVVFEVLEHVPSPVDVVKNLHAQMNDNALFCENFIKHDEKDLTDGSDLSSAARERVKYYEFLTSNFDLVGGPKEELSPDATRIWKKR